MKFKNLSKLLCSTYWSMLAYFKQIFTRKVSCYILFTNTFTNEHSVIIDDNINNDAIRFTVECVTMLLDYFELNAEMRWGNNTIFI